MDGKIRRHLRTWKPKQKNKKFKEEWRKKEEERL